MFLAPTQGNQNVVVQRHTSTHLTYTMRRAITSLDYRVTRIAHKHVRALKALVARITSWVVVVLRIVTERDGVLHVGGALGLARLDDQLDGIHLVLWRD